MRERTIKMKNLTDAEDAEDTLVGAWVLKLFFRGFGGVWDF